MADDLRSVLSALDDLLAAYRRRIAELEQIVSNQQGQLEALKPRLAEEKDVEPQP